MKVIVSVAKAYKHRGNHNHKATTKKVWHIYYLEYDDFEEKCEFKSEQCNALQAMYYKAQIQYKKRFYCSDCDTIFDAYVKKRQKEVDCPFCESD